MVAFNLSTAAGLAELEAHLTSRSYISGYTASRDDLAVYVALSSAPSAPHSARWYKHVTALLGSSFAGKAEGVSVGGAASAAAAADEDEVMDYGDDESDEELDLFGDETEEEKAAMAAKAEVIATAKARGAEKAKLSKSMIILDVKPWDDETDMAKLEAHVRAIVKDGLLWGTSTLVPIGFGIKKLQITCIIEDFKVPSFDEIIEDHIVMDGENEYIQSADIAAFNKL